MFEESGAVQAHELIEEIRGMRSDFRTALTKLFGDAETENPHGRIPRLENVTSDLVVRVGALETLLSKGQGAWHLAGWLVAVVLALTEIAYHGSAIFSYLKGR